MRELKFRIWDNHTERYVTFVYEANKDCYLFIGRSGYVTAFNCYGEEIDFEDGRFVVQQYTGLKDKNEKEIYEGDIVEFKTPVHGNLVTDTVVFDNGSFILEEMEYNLSDTKVRVIGNLFETPELLK